MTEQKNATMQLPMDLIAPAIQAHVNAAVIEALKGSDILISELVKQIAGQLVDGEGKTGNYNSKTPWLTWVIQKIVRERIQETIREHLGDKGALIKKAIEAEMKKSNSKLVRSLVDGMASAMANEFAASYRCKIEFSSQ